MYRAKTDDYVADRNELTRLADRHARLDYIIFVHDVHDGQFCVDLSDEPLEEEFGDHTEFSDLEQVAEDFKVDAEEHGYVCLEENNPLHYE